MNRGIRFFSLLLPGLVLAGCLGGCRSNPAQLHPTMIVEQLEQETPGLSIDSLHPQFRLLHEEKEVRAFYKALNGAPVWGDDGFASDSLLAFIRNIRYYGLLPQDYHFRELSALEGNPDRTPDQRFRREILLTDAFLRILMHLRSGRLNSSPPMTDSIDAQLLRSAVADGTVRRFLQSQEPVFAGYRALKEGLKPLSHGCVRVEKAEVLAHYLVTGEIGKSSPLVLRFLKERERHTVELPASVPIHLRYFTAEFAEGRMRTYEDIYSKDDALMIRAREATASSGL